MIPAPKICPICHLYVCTPTINDEGKEVHGHGPNMEFCHGHPPRDGREDGERCDGSGWTMLTQSGQWPPEREMCLGCDNCRNQEAAKGEEICPLSQRVDGKKHSWAFDGDDPYVVCAWCKERRDALTNKVIDERHASPSEVGGEEWEKELENLEGCDKPFIYGVHCQRCEIALREFIRTLRSRSEKVGEARAWGKAVAAIPYQKMDGLMALKEVRMKEIETRGVSMTDYNAGHNDARLKLIQAAKDDGHQVG